MSAATQAEPTQILVTVNHDSEREAALFRGANRQFLGATHYASTVSAQRKIEKIARRHALANVDEAWQIQSLGIYCAVFSVQQGRSAEALVERLGRDSDVESVQLMSIYHTSSSIERGAALDGEPSYNDTYFKKQYGKRHSAVYALHKASTGKDIKIAVIDTGADTVHDEFKGVAISQLNIVDSDRRRFRQDRHGTAVLGMIVASPDNQKGIVGLAPEAEISLIKACWYPETDIEGSAICNSLTISAALDAAITQNVEIINMSLAGPEDALVARLIHRAVEEGVFVVAADPGTGRNRYPALLPEVIGISSTDSLASSLSGNSQPRINYVAEDRLSTAPGNTYDFYSGASISAAITSAMLANSLQQRPDMSFAERIDEIQGMLLSIASDEVARY